MAQLAGVAVRMKAADFPVVVSVPAAVVRPEYTDVAKPARLVGEAACAMRTVTKASGKLEMVEAGGQDAALKALMEDPVAPACRTVIVPRTRINPAKGAE